MLSEQDGKCAICRIDRSKLSKAMVVDHCHETGKIRGLLCGKCNSGIGLLKDSSKLCQVAANYLKLGRYDPTVSSFDGLTVVEVSPVPSSPPSSSNA